MRALPLLPVVLLGALAASAGAWAEVGGAAAPDAPLTLADRFASTSLLYENAFSIAHGANLDPMSTREWTMILRGTFALEATRHLGLGVTAGFSAPIFETETTFRNEVWWEDVSFGATLTGPALGAAGASPGPLSGRTGLDVALPTSKASVAETLIFAASAWGEGSVTAPVLDGLALTYRFTATPRAHRATTMETLVARPCSPATGCSQGRSTDLGWLNTRLQLTHGISASLSAWSALALTVSYDATYGFLYAKSPSDRYDETTLSDPANAGGTPVSFSSAFVIDLTVTPVEAFSVGLGLWTPGGLRPDGGWYHPFANRWTQAYVDLTFYPVALGTSIAAARTARGAK